MAVWLVTLAACGHTSASRAVDDGALRAADSDAANWTTYGGTYSEQHFSPLKQIDEQTVSRLGSRGPSISEPARLEATSLVKDGVLYTTSAWSLVYAFDARTGQRLWMYDPHVAKTTPNSCAAMWSIARRAL